MPSRTRTRVSRACTRCRQRKDKCDGATPSCANCLNVQQPCSYDQATKKRGLPEGYVRAIEKLWAVSFARIPGLEDALLQMLQQDRHLFTTIWNHREIGEELHARWKDSRMFQELEGFLANVDHSAATGSKRKRERDDEDELEGSLDLNSVLAPRYTLQDSTQPASSLPTTSVVAPQTFKLPAGASEVMGHYFKFTHAWFPILDRPQTLRLCYQLSKTATEVNPHNGPLAVLAAALAYTSRQRSAATEAAGLLGLDANELTKVARRCIPDVFATFEYHHLQALLILALADITVGDWEPAWRVVGLAARMLVEMITPAEGQPRAHVALNQGCLVLDTLIGVRLGRLPQLRQRDQLDSLCLSPDGHEEWEPWPGTTEPAFVISSFNCLTRLLATLTRYLHEKEALSGQLAIDRMDAVQEDLATLIEGYPPASQPLNSTTGPPHQVWLKMTHLLVVACVASTQESGVDLAIGCFGSVNSIFKGLEKRSAPETLQIPAWMLGPVHAAFRHLSSFVECQRYAPHPKHVSVLKVLVKHFSNILWPASEELTHLLERVTRRKEGDAAPATANRWASSERLSSIATSLPPQRPAFFPVDPFAQTGMTSIRSHGGHIQNVALNGSDLEQSPGDFMQADWSSGIDIPTENSNLQDGGLVTGPTSIGAAQNSLGMYNPSIATSPSFQGDEIDALFHEMAQLDTTEWTSGRDQGLKDFGFDDLTFEQFCNDPDRLFSGSFVDARQPTLHHKQSSDFSMPDLLPQTQNFAYDMPPSVWNG